MRGGSGGRWPPPPSGEPLAAETNGSDDDLDLLPPGEDDDLPNVAVDESFAPSPAPAAGVARAVCIGPWFADGVSSGPAVCVSGSGEASVPVTARSVGVSDRGALGGLAAGWVGSAYRCPLASHPDRPARRRRRCAGSRPARWSELEPFAPGGRRRRTLIPSSARRRRDCCWVSARVRALRPLKMMGSGWTLVSYVDGPLPDNFDAGVGRGVAGWGSVRYATTMLSLRSMASSATALVRSTVSRTEFICRRIGSKGASRSTARTGHASDNQKHASGEEKRSASPRPSPAARSPDEPQLGPPTSRVVEALVRHVLGVPATAPAGAPISTLRKQ